MDTLDNLKRYLNIDVLTSKIVVIGLGVTGQSVIGYLKKLSFDITVIDSRHNPPDQSQLHKDYPDMPILTGHWHDKIFAQATHLIVSPGVSLKEPAICLAVENGACIVGDIDLFVCSTNAPIVAISGSNGKSTVTTMLGAMASQDGKKVGVGGNLGIPALDLLDDHNELYVLELSSFQLERTHLLNATAATVLNISADHFDRHDSLQVYADEKQKIFSGNGVMVLNLDDPVVLNMHRLDRQVMTFSVQKKADFYLREDGMLCRGQQVFLSAKELPLEGLHNIANALAALALGSAVGLSQHAMSQALKDFRGLAHRMNKVVERDGVTWINDSKATNIGACIAALAGYQTPVILLAGGDAKGADMRELRPVVQEKTRAVIVMGQDAPNIEVALCDVVAVYHASNMVEAVRIAAHMAKPGDTVLLSPACASLDQYKSYADRGEQFSRAVLEL